MTTLDQQVANLTDNTNALLASVAAKKPTLDGYLTTLSGNATSAITSETAALTSYNSAVISSNAAQISTDLAQAAWNSVSAPNETLAAINKTFFTASGIVAAIIYDTKKDSDGGAWRKRCQSTSWYNETVYGNYLGERVTEFQARNAGAAVSAEVILNGNFASTANWTTTSNWAIAGGVATFGTVAAGNQVMYPAVAPLTLGVTYKVTYDVVVNSGSFVAYTGNTGGGTYRTASGHYEEYTTCVGNTALYLYAVAGFTGSVTNVSVKAVISQTTLANDYFHNTTDGKFYALNATSGVTEVFRGGRREFPEVVAITAEAGRVIIWDLTDSSVPMWMVFVVSYNLHVWGSAASCLVATNGCILAGTFNGGYSALPFITDAAYVKYSGGDLCPPIRSIVSRNLAQTWTPLVVGNRLISNTVNSIAATVLPNAPMDPATGLPVPTIAVGTAGGVSVIKDDGSVVNLSDAIYGNIRSIKFTADNRLSLTSSYLGLADDNKTHILDIPAASANVSFQNALIGVNDHAFLNQPGYIPSPLLTINSAAALGGSRLVAGQGSITSVSSNTGLNLLKRNPISPNSSLVAYVTNTYNTGWMNGDIRLAALADSDRMAGGVESISGANLITGDSANFNGGTVGGWILNPNYWGAAQGATISAASGALVTTNVGPLAIVSMSWLAGVVTVTTAVPHTLVTSQDFVIIGAVPAGYSIESSATVINATTFTFNLATNPGVVTTLGTVGGYVLAQLNTTGLTIGTGYLVKLTRTATTPGALFRAGSTGSGNNYFDGYPVDGAITFSFVAASSTLSLSSFIMYSAPAGATSTIDDVSLSVVATDRSVKANPLTIYGQLGKAQVASNNNLVAYSGFSMKNYLEQPYSANLDYGTGDFYYGFWGTFGGPGWDEYPWSRTTITPVVGDIQLRWSGSAQPILEYWNGSAWVIAVGYPTQVLGTQYHKIEVLRRSGVAYMYVDGAQVATAAFTGTVSSTSPFRVGNSLSPSSAGYSLSYHTGTLALLRSSATAPSADQIAYMYESERKLFESGAQCTIDGSSTAVTALAYDEISDLLHVGTSWGRSSFKGLARAYSEQTTNGAAITYAVNDSDLITVGATGAKLMLPPTVVRDELLRGYEQKKVFGQKLIGVDFDSVTSQTTFVLPLGFKTRSVTSAGNNMRMGASKDYTVNNDGFRDSVVFNVAPGNGVWINVQCTRKL